MRLSEEKCRKIETGTLPLGVSEAEELSREAPLWGLKDKSIEREYKFRDFRESIGFVNRIAEAADKEDHHPDILISYDKVRITFTTHKIGGLSRNDFIMAAKIDGLRQSA